MTYIYKNKYLLAGPLGAYPTCGSWPRPGLLRALVQVGQRLRRPRNPTSSSSLRGCYERVLFGWLISGALCSCEAPTETWLLSPCECPPPP